MAWDVTCVIHTSSTTPSTQTTTASQTFSTVEDQPETSENPNASKVPTLRVEATPACTHGIVARLDSSLELSDGQTFHWRAYETVSAEEIDRRILTLVKIRPKLSANINPLMI